MTQWHHTCCWRQAICFRLVFEEAIWHATERARLHKCRQAVRWSQRAGKWFIRNAKARG